MKIATFNINNVNKRLANLLDWLSVTQPDVVCLQELKAEDRAFPIDALEAVGYGAVWRGTANLEWGGDPRAGRYPGDYAARAAGSGKSGQTSSVFRRHRGVEG